MARDLPARPDLEHLRKQARDLLRDYDGGEPTAVEKFRALRRRRPGKPKLADAQRLVAREYGFPSWARLKTYVESSGIAVDPVGAAVAAIKAGDARELARLLRRHGELRARIDEPLPGLAFDTVAIVAAAQRGDREMVDVLLGAGANIDGRSRWWAGGFGVLDVAPPAFAPFLLERGATLNANAAARLDMRDALAELVARDPATVRVRGGDGQTPLHVAASAQVAAFLIDHGAEIDALDVDHESTPAQYALGERHDVARHLVAHGCRTDILMAAALGDAELVGRHLDADPERIRTTVTAKYFPMRNPHAGGTIYIWTLGANMTAHRVARRFGHEHVFQLLMERTPDVLRVAVAAALADDRLLRDLLALHPDVVRRLGADERAHLVAAAHDDNLEAVRAMLAAGWPADTRDSNGVTALHWAAFHGNARMVREILRHAPPLELRDPQFGATPLGWATHGSLHGWHVERGDYAAVVDALLDAGASLPDRERDASDAVRAVLEARRSHA